MKTALKKQRLLFCHFVTVCTVLPLMFAAGCHQDYSSECTTDADCGSGELCDFLSGQCVIGGVDFEEGVFEGDFACEIGQDAEHAAISGLSSIYGGWGNELLVMNSMIMCYYLDTDEVTVSILARRQDGEEIASYLMDTRMLRSDVTGDSVLSVGPDLEPGRCTLILVRAPFVNGVSGDAEILGYATKGQVEVSVINSSTDLIEGTVEVLISPL